MSDHQVSGTKAFLYRRFKELVDEGNSPFQVAEALMLTENELVEFEVSYANEKLVDSSNDDDDFPFDGEAA